MQDPRYHWVAGTQMQVHLHSAWMRSEAYIECCAASADDVVMALAEANIMVHSFRTVAIEGDHHRALFVRLVSPSNIQMVLKACGDWGGPPLPPRAPIRFVEGKGVVRFFVAGRNGYKVSPYSEHLRRAAWVDGTPFARLSRSSQHEEVRLEAEGLRKEIGIVREAMRVCVDELRAAKRLKESVSYELNLWRPVIGNAMAENAALRQSEALNAKENQLLRQSLAQAEAAAASAAALNAEENQSLRMAFEAACHAGDALRLYIDSLAPADAAAEPLQ